MPLQLELPTFYSYNSHLNYDADDRDCPTYVVIDAIRQWGDAFHNHPPIPGWSSNWENFSLTKSWIPPRPIWLMYDQSFMAEAIIHEVRNRLRIFGDVVPILYNIENHSRVILRSGSRIIYCHSTTFDEDNVEDSPYPNVLGLLPVSYSDFISSDSTTILSHINNFDSQRNLDSRDPQASFQWRVMSANFYRCAITAAASIGKEADEKTFDEWTEYDWTVVREIFMRDYYG